MQRKRDGDKLKDKRKKERRRICIQMAAESMATNWWRLGNESNDWKNGPGDKFRPSPSQPCDGSKMFGRRRKGKKGTGHDDGQVVIQGWKTSPKREESPSSWKWQNLLLDWISDQFLYFVAKKMVLGSSRICHQQNSRKRKKEEKALWTAGVTFKLERERRKQWEKWKAWPKIYAGKKHENTNILWMSHSKFKTKWMDSEEKAKANEISAKRAWNSKCKCKTSWANWICRWLGSTDQRKL